MVRTRPALPHGHGELLLRPEFAQWAPLLSATHERLSAEETVLGGLPLARLRADARREALAEAYAFSRGIGTGFELPAEESSLVALTGHQPELFHPGVWAKHFLLDRLCAETGAVGIDLVVDTDAFDAVALNAPCLHPRVDRCRQEFVRGGQAVTFVGTPVPDAGRIEQFCEGGAALVEPLPAPAIARHFAEYCAQLRSSAGDVHNLGELLTFARRRYEAPARTSYLELPVSRLSGTGSYLRFAAHLMLDAAGFATAHNEALADYRQRSKTRSSAQPFPDLGARDGRVEAPFWFVADGARVPAWVALRPDGVVVYAGDEPVASCPPAIEPLADALRRAPLLAPRATTLTMFARLVLGDLFIHGVGGGRYDAVTDAVIERYLGLEPPPYAVASLTMYLPLGAHVVTEDEVRDARQRLHRFEHNPDTMLGEVEFDSSSERVRASELAAEKTRLVAAIREPDADKKALGARIRELNELLGELLEPVIESARAEAELLEAQHAASEVFTDRTYPFCLWSPLEVQDKTR